MPTTFRVGQDGHARTVRRLLVGVVLVIGVGLAPHAQAAPRTMLLATDGASQLFALVNGERANNGLPPLAWRDDVAAIAVGWTQQMAASQQLAHNDAYFSPSTKAAIGSKANGENVAMTTSIEAAHAALMNSPQHRANILNPIFTDGGFGAVQDSRGVWWVTEDFMQSSGAPAPAPAPEPAAPDPEPVAEAPAPEPAAAPAPAPVAPPTTAAPTPTTAAPAPAPTAPAATAPVVPLSITHAADAELASADIGSGKVAAPEAPPLGLVAVACGLLVINAFGLRAARRRAFLTVDS